MVRHRELRVVYGVYHRNIEGRVQQRSGPYIKVRYKFYSLLGCFGGYRKHCPAQILLSSEIGADLLYVSTAVENMPGLAFFRSVDSIRVCITSKLAFGSSNSGHS